MDVDSTIVISDSDSEEIESKTAKKKVTKVHSFVPILPKNRPTTNKIVSSAGSVTSGFKAVDDTNKAYNSRMCVIPIIAAGKIAPQNITGTNIQVKSFAKEKTEKCEKTMQQNIIYVNNKPLIHTPSGTFVNIASAHADTIKISNHGRPPNNAKPELKITQPNNIKVSQIKNLALPKEIIQVMNDGHKFKLSTQRPIAAKRPFPENARLTHAPIKLVDINSILRQTLVDTPELPKNQTSTELPPKQNNTINAESQPELITEKGIRGDSSIMQYKNGRESSVPLNPCISQSHVNYNAQKIFIRTSDTIDKRYLPEQVSKIIKSVPSLSNSQNIYLINIPNNGQFALNSLPQQHVIFPQPGTSQNIDIQSPPDLSKVSNLTKFQDAFTDNHNYNNDHIPRKSVSNTPKEKVAKKPVCSHRCLDLRKTGYKIDIEGFTFFDRLGFFKAEEKRAKRCENILNYHIKVRRSILDKLLLKHNTSLNASPKQSEVPYKNRMEKLVEKCKTEAMQNQTKLVSKLETTLKSKKRAEKTPKIHRRYKRRFKAAQCRKDKYSKFNLKELKVVLSRVEVEQYLNLQKSRNFKYPTIKDVGYEVSRRKIPLLYTKRITLKQLLSFKTNDSITFVDDNYIELVQQLEQSEEYLYYINKHNVITALYMEFFPLFKKAVQSHRVQIVDQSVFDKYMLISDSNEKAKVKTYCNISHNINNKQKNVSKSTTFCNFVTNFHLFQKNSELQSKIISSEHNYYFVKKKG